MLQDVNQAVFAIPGLFVNSRSVGRCFLSNWTGLTGMSSLLGSAFKTTPCRYNRDLLQNSKGLVGVLALGDESDKHEYTVVTF